MQIITVLPKPIGTCMVSSEGAFAAYYKYGRLSTVANVAVPTR